MFSSCRKALLLGCLGVLGVTASGLTAKTTVSDKDLEVLLPYDLGPASVDVSHYPANQQDNYRLFLQKCSVCHTPARALNFPLVSNEEWLRFVSTMHDNADKTLLTGEDLHRIADFLSFDSEERKVNGLDDFAASLRILQKRFAQIQLERQRRCSCHP